MMKLALLSLSLLALSACSMVPADQGQRPAALTFAHIAPVEVHAAAVQLPADYMAPLGEQDVANDFLIPPSKIVHDYFQHKLVAAGAANRIEVELEKASMIREHVPSESKFMKFIDMGATYKYAMVVQFKILLRGDDGRAVGGKRLGFNKQFFIPVSDSIAAREMKQMEVLESLVKDMDQAVSAYLSEESLALPEVAR